MAHDVFISYATSDKAVADAVCSQLESIHRIRCWIAPRDVTPGASWAESIIDALDGSKIMVLIFSSNANASMQIEREVERAVHKGIHIIPLRIENTIPTKTLEYFISAPHWLDALSVPLELHITKLAAGVKALLSKHGASGSKTGRDHGRCRARGACSNTGREGSRPGATQLDRSRGGRCCSRYRRGGRCNALEARAGRGKHVPPRRPRTRPRRRCSRSLQLSRRRQRHPCRPLPPVPVTPVAPEAPPAIAEAPVARSQSQSVRGFSKYPGGGHGHARGGWAEEVVRKARLRTEGWSDERGENRPPLRGPR